MKSPILASLLLLLTLTACDNTTTDEPVIDPTLVRVKVKVIDYSPAPGQFINTLPQVNPGTSREDVIAKVEAVFNGSDDAAVITLGAFGGTVTVKTAEPISGTFQVIGNAIPTQGEPGLISISADGNKWYDIPGENYSKAKRTTVTYHRPADGASDQDYIRWETADGASGYLSRIPDFHTQNYFPEWENSPTMTFTALRLPDNLTFDNKTLQYVLTPMNGYADCFPNNNNRSLIDPSKAVDNDGKPAPITSFSYIRVHSSTLQNCGPLGEASTEVGGFKTFK
ncbi:MAG: hypothetical protein K2O00_06590 [Muribaculaceae bacterium]|nr:hypothetical protein [Muribaculaceae bacterium]